MHIQLCKLFKVFVIKIRPLPEDSLMHFFGKISSKLNLFIHEVAAACLSSSLFPQLCVPESIPVPPLTALHWLD